MADALSRPAPEPTQATSTATASTRVSSSSSGRPLLGGNVPLPTQHHQTETSTPSVPSPVCSLGTGAEAASQGSAIDYRRLAVSQSRSPELLEAARSSSLQVAPFQVEGETLFCDVSSGAVRPLIPAENRFSVFQQIHNISHAGARATGRMVAARFVWPRMGADIRAWVRECQQCARTKVNLHAHTPVQPIQVPRRKFAHIHIDLVGPFPTSAEGYTHLLTMVDRATRWAEATPISGTSVRDCAEAFFRGWISRFGVPD